MKRKGKCKVVLVMIGLLAVAGLKLTHESGSRILANPDKEIVIDEGLTPDISMTIPKDSTKLFESELDKVLYKDYVQGNKISRTSKKNEFSLYSSRADFKPYKYQSANNMLPLSNGNFIVTVYDTDGKLEGRQILYYVKNTGEILGEFDVNKHYFKFRFEDFTNLGMEELDGKYKFSILGRNGGFSSIFIMELDTTENRNEFKIVDTIPSTKENISSNFFENKSISNNPLTVDFLNSLTGNQQQNNEFVDITPFVSYDLEQKKLIGLGGKENTIQIFNPGSKKYGNLHGKPGYTDSDEANTSISALYKIDDSNYLIMERAYLYKKDFSDPIVVASISLYDNNFVFKKNLYVTDALLSTDPGIETFSYFEDLTANGKAYVYIYSATKESKLVCIDTVNSAMDIVKEYPPNTSFLLNKSQDTITYVASTNGDIPELNKFGVNKPAIINGEMNEDFSIRNLSGLDVPNADYNLFTSKQLQLSSDLEMFAVYGSTTVPSTSPEFSNHLPTSGIVENNKSKIFFGTYARKSDYSPIIKKASNLIYKVDEEKDKEEKDLQLLSGIQVYDTVDSNSILFGQDWLDRRLNRNINTFDNDTGQYGASIDWAKLGFEDDRRIGPNKVTYFITDSNLSVTSTSRIVNKIDSKTKYDESTAKAALHAENFAIKLKDLQALQKKGGLTKELLTDQATTDTYGKVLAWDLDSGTNYNSDVSVDANQLAEINSADKFDRYPLEYTITKNGKALTRSTYVFVLDDNSELKGDTIFVINAGNFKLPWDQSHTATPAEMSTTVKTNSNVVAYDFDSGDDVTSSVHPVESDITALIALEPTDTANPPTQKNPTQGVHFTRGEDTSTITSTVEVYYRFETLTVHFVDVAFGQLYDVEKNEVEPTSVILADQIVGKTVTNLTSNKDVAEQLTTIKGKGYQQEKLYQSDKKTEITTNSVEITYQEGEGISLYLRFKGLLTLVSVPDTIDFNIQTLDPSKKIRVNDPTVTGDLVVSDTRAGTDNQWVLKVSLTKPIQSTNKTGTKVTLPNALRYKPKNKEEMTITSEAQEVLRETNGFGTYNVSSDWGKTKEADGFKFETSPVNIARLGEYTGEITYTISDTFEP